LRARCGMPPTTPARLPRTRGRDALGALPGRVYHERAEPHRSLTRLSKDAALVQTAPPPAHRRRNRAAESVRPEVRGRSTADRTPLPPSPQPGRCDVLQDGRALERRGEPGAGDLPALLESGSVPRR